MSAILVITEPSGKTWEIGIVEGRTYSIGRAKENDIVLNDRRVSRKHAFIDGSDTAFMIVDGSKEMGELVRSVNHVFVNGTPELEHVLDHGDILTIGESSIEFKKVGAKKAVSEIPNALPSVAIDPPI